MPSLLNWLLTKLPSQQDWQHLRKYENYVVELARQSSGKGGSAELSLSPEEVAAIEQRIVHDAINWKHLMNSS